MQEYYGNFCKRIPTDVDLPAVSSFENVIHHRLSALEARRLLVKIGIGRGRLH